MTSISDHGRSWASVFDSMSSVTDGPLRMRLVVLTRLRLQASPISAAAWTSCPEVATMTTRSALPASSIRSRVRPVRSASQPCMEKPRPGGAPANAEAVKKLALFQRRWASDATTVSLAWSSAMTLTRPGLELGASIRNRASAPLDILALSLCMRWLFLRVPGPSVPLSWPGYPGHLDDLRADVSIFGVEGDKPGNDGSRVIQD